MTSLKSKIIQLPQENNGTRRRTTSIVTTRGSDLIRVVVSEGLSYTFNTFIKLIFDTYLTAKMTLHTDFLN